MKFMNRTKKVEIESPIDVNLTCDAYAYASCDENVRDTVMAMVAGGVAIVTVMAISGVKKLKIKMGSSASSITGANKKKKTSTKKKEESSPSVEIEEEELED